MSWNLSAVPQIEEWLGDIEPIWTRFDPPSLSALCGEPGRKPGAIQLATDLSEGEAAVSEVATNVVKLVCCASASGGLKLTTTGNLARAVVIDLCSALQWRDDHIRTVFEISKAVNEGDFTPLHFVRIVAQQARLLQRLRGKLIVTKLGRGVLDGQHSPELQAKLFYAAFWRTNLAYFDRAAHPSWPQSHIGVVLWSLSACARDWQPPERLVRLCTLPVLDVIAMPPSFAVAAFDWRVLQPLVQFGLLERRDDPTDHRFAPDASYRKSALFDRFLTFRLS
jgi:hypothetical protein